MALERLFSINLRQCILTSFRNGTSDPISRFLRHDLGNTWYRQHGNTRAMSSIPQLVVHPQGHLLMDDKLEIKITGLHKDQKTTLHAVIREGSSVFESCCCYTADENGEVNLATQPSLAGSYTGVSPMGIFWSMVQAPGQKDGLRLTKKDMDSPMVTNIAVYDDHLSVDTVHQTSPDPISLASVERWYKAPGVRREVVRDGRIRGVLYLPQGDGPFPGVIDMFGTAGGIIEFRSALLASRGFAALSLPYFRYEDLPDTIFDLEFEYFLEAIDWLCSHRDVYHDGIGVLGVSKGADLALLMATYSPKVRCVVCINGCTFLGTYRMTYKGGVIRHVPLQLDKMYMEEGAVVSKDCLPYTNEDLIPAWEGDAKILNIIGEDDKCSDYGCIYFMKENFPPEKRGSFEIVPYPNAGHLIEPPYTPLCRMSYHKLFDTKFMWGGYPEPHAFAQEDSWRRILEYFNQYIPRTSQRDLHTASKL